MSAELDQLRATFSWTRSNLAELGQPGPNFSNCPPAPSEDVPSKSAFNPNFERSRPKPYFPMSPPEADLLRAEEGWSSGRYFEDRPLRAALARLLPATDTGAGDERLDRMRWGEGAPCHRSASCRSSVELVWRNIASDAAKAKIELDQTSDDDDQSWAKLAPTSTEFRPKSAKFALVSVKLDRNPPTRRDESGQFRADPPSLALVSVAPCRWVLAGHLVAPSSCPILALQVTSAQRRTTSWPLIH